MATESRLTRLEEVYAHLATKDDVAELKAEVAASEARIEARLAERIAEAEARIESRVETRIAEAEARIESRVADRLAVSEARMEERLAKFEARLLRWLLPTVVTSIIAAVAVSALAG